jgi:hypothetical protein
MVSRNTPFVSETMMITKKRDKNVNPPKNRKVPQGDLARSGGEMRVIVKLAS